LCEKGLNAKDIHKEIFLVYNGKCLSCKAVHSWVEKCHLDGKRFTDDVKFETEMTKWLRQQTKDFYTAGFDAVVKQWDKCINVGGGYVEK
jgi:hypothetical protein